MPFEQKMRAAGVMEAAIGAFRHNYEALCREETGLIPEEAIRPAEGLAVFEPGDASFDPALLAQVVVEHLGKLLKRQLSMLSLAKDIL